MPGSPPTSTRFGAPRYSDSDAAAFSAQVNAITDTFDAGAAKLVPVVSALPSTPTDGDEIYFLADSSKGIIWHLRYRAASTSTYKWEWVGGTPLYSQTTVNVQESPGTTLATVNIPTLPNGGDFLLHSSVQIDTGVNGRQGGGITSVTVAPNAWLQLQVWSDDGSRVIASGSGDAVITGLASGTSLQMGFAAEGSAAPDCTDAFLSARPIRVG